MAKVGVGSIGLTAINFFLVILTLFGVTVLIVGSSFLLRVIVILWRAVSDVKFSKSFKSAIEFLECANPNALTLVTILFGVWALPRLICSFLVDGVNGLRLTTVSLCFFGTLLRTIGIRILTLLSGLISGYSSVSSEAEFSKGWLSSLSKYALSSYNDFPYNPSAGLFLSFKPLRCSPEMFPVLSLCSFVHSFSKHAPRFVSYFKISTYNRTIVIKFQIYNVHQILRIRRVSESIFVISRMLFFIYFFFYYFLFSAVYLYSKIVYYFLRHAFGRKQRLIMKDRNYAWPGWSSCGRACGGGIEGYFVSWRKYMT